MRILVVDDDTVFRQELGELLQDDHHAVTTVPSVPKAVEELERAEFDVILTDLKMPRHSGMELLREARHRWPRTPVVMITGFATVETALEALKLGAFDYVRKPFEIDQVRETLRLVEQEREFAAPADGRRDPAREAAALAAGGKHEVLLIGDPGAGSGAHLRAEPLDPKDLSGLEARIDAFVTEHPNAAVVIAGVERMVQSHRLEDVVGMLERLRARLSDHGPLRVGFNPRKVPATAAAALGTAVAADSTHATLEAFANPIRRAVLFRLAAGPAAFRETMDAAGLHDSPKMAFHLRKLVESGLILHEGDTYRLTARGTAGVRLLTDAAFLPPAGDEQNLAFAKGPEGARRRGE